MNINLLLFFVNFRGELVLIKKSPSILEQLNEVSPPPQK